MTASDSKHQRDRIKSKRTAAAASGAAALCTMLAMGLQWKLPMLAMPSLDSGKFAASEVVFVERTPAAPVESSRTERHLAEKSSFSAPVPSEEHPTPRRQRAEDKPTIKPPHAREKTSPMHSRQEENNAPIAKTSPVRAETKPDSTVLEASHSNTIDGSAADGAEGKGRASRRDDGVDSGASRNALNEALAMLIDEVDRNKRYPRRARQIGAQGTVVLGIDIDSNGRIQRVFVLQSAGFAQLDRAAEKAAQTLIGMQIQINEAATIRLPVKFMLKS